MKQKFQSLDVAAIAIELQSKLVGLRLQNVYDASSKLYLWKFAKPDVKEVLLVESGIRVHLTDYARDKGGMPGSFCMKLRKHLRTKRLNALRQLGVDRILDFEFGHGEGVYHVLMEFYASGNIILTDKDYMILSLLRVVQPDENVRFAVGEYYDTSSARPYSPLTLDRLSNLLTDALAKSGVPTTDSNNPKKKKESKNAVGKEVVKKFYGSRLELPATLIEHCLIRAGLPPNMKMNALIKNEGGEQVDLPKLEQLAEALRLGDDLLQKMIVQGESMSSYGYITLKQVVTTEPSSASAGGSTPFLVVGEGADQITMAYDEFHPILYEQYNVEGAFKQYASYNKAVDAFFSSIEAQKAELKARQLEESATKRLDQVRNEQQSRIEGLVVAQASNERKAQLIELNLEQVDQAIMVICSAVAASMDWVDLKRLVEEEKRKQNPVALLIHDIKLQTNQIVLKLDEPDYQADFGFSSSDSEDENEQHPKSELIEIDLSLTAYANARQYYGFKKASAVKQLKTEKAVSVALKSAEKQVREEMLKIQVKPVVIAKMRKPFWFERFQWFISSENLLVLGGRDAQQNEQLVKKHLRKGDAYVHADLAGSSSVIVKNPTGEPISPVTLSQAGTMAICHSRAWDAKIVTSAWWVNYDQVSKTAPTGEYLTTGSFMIRGKKNYLPPSQLVYGFGFLYRVADECIGRHLHERRPQLRGDLSAASDRGSKEIMDGGDNIISTQTSQESSSNSLGTSPLPVKDDDAQSISQFSLAESSRVREEKYNLDEYGHSEEADSAIDLLPRRKVDQPRKKYVSTKQRRKKGKSAFGDELDNQESGTTPLIDPVEIPKTTIDPTATIAENIPQTESVALPSSDEVQNEPTEDKPAHTEFSEGEQEKEESYADSDEDQEEIQRMLDEEKVALPNEDELENLSYLDSLTGNPHPDDIIVACLPVCAPFSVLQTYKHRVKLVPGALKKGKAAKSAVSTILARKDIPSVEKDYMKSVPEHELLAAMLAKVKIMAPGMDQQKQRGKNKKNK